MISPQSTQSTQRQKEILQSTQTTQRQAKFDTKITKDMKSTKIAKDMKSTK